MPDDQQVGVEPVVYCRGEDLAERLVHPHRQVADDAVEVHREAAHLVDEPRARHEGHRAALRAGDLMDDRLRADFTYGVDDGVGYFRQGVVPADALPAAGAPFADALERIEHTLLGVQHLPPHGAFVAAHGVHVRHAFFDRVVSGGLFFVQDKAVLDVDPVRTVAGVAVDAVGTPHYAVPLPALPVEVVLREVGQGGGRFAWLQVLLLLLRHRGFPPVWS